MKRYGFVWLILLVLWQPKVFSIGQYPVPTNAPIDVPLKYNTICHGSGVMAPIGAKRPLVIGRTARHDVPINGAGGLSAHRGAPPVAGSAYDNWLQSDGAGALIYEEDGIGYYDLNTLYDLYNQYTTDNDMPGGWEEFLNWFNNSGKYGTPIDDGIWMLVVLMSLYVTKKRKERKTAL